MPDMPDMDPEEMERKAVKQLGPLYKWLWDWPKLVSYRAPISPQRELWTKLEGWKPVRYDQVWKQYQPIQALRVIMPLVVEVPFEPDDDCVVSRPKLRGRK